MKRRISLSSFKGYLTGDWRSLIADIKITVPGDGPFNAAYGILTGTAETEGSLSVELLGIGSQFHNLIFPGGSIGRRQIYTYENYPRLTAMNSGGHRVLAVLSPTQMGGSFDHVPSFRGKIEELTIATTEPLEAQALTNGSLMIWLPNSEKLWAYQPTCKVYSRAGVQTRFSTESDWLTFDTTLGTFEFEQTSENLTKIEITPKEQLGIDQLKSLSSASLKALSLLFTRRLNPLIEGITFDELQMVKLHPVSEHYSGSRLVGREAEAEIEWLGKATSFFYQGGELATKTWSAFAQVLDSTNHYQYILRSVAIEHMARAYWTLQLRRGKGSFKMKDKLAEILESMGQPFVQKELDDWRWYRDGCLHGDQNFVDAPAKDKMERWPSLERLCFKLLAGMVEYRGPWYS